MIQLPNDLGPISLADWLEISLLGQIDEPHRISDAEIAGTLRDADADPETYFGDLSLEIQRRSRLLRERYLLVRDGYGFSRRGEWRTQLPYSFMLFTSLNQHYETLVFARGTAVRPAEMFENLTALALQKYVGGKVVRIGAPRRAPVPIPFPDAVQYLAQSTSEEFGYGQLEIQQSGDDNVDVIAWRPHVDSRASQVVILAQCAIGTDWRTKRSELDVNIWRHHVRWLTQPVKAFAVPFLIDSEASWRETAARGGLILDRLRITSLLEDPLPRPLAREMEDWCAARLVQASALALG